MTQIWPGRRAALGGAALCALTLVGAWSDPPAWSTKQKPLPVVAAVAIPNQTATSAEAKEVTASARRRFPTTPRTTSTTVMGGGNPSTWPAAREKAPSLAGAYSLNLKTAFLALVRYSDWLGTHPNPKLVKNYVLPTSNIYRAQEYLMRQMVVARVAHFAGADRDRLYQGSHTPCNTNITRQGTNTWAALSRRHQRNEISVSRHSSGRVVGHTRAVDRRPTAVTLVQDSLHTQFYIDLWEQLTPPGDGFALGAPDRGQTMRRIALIVLASLAWSEEYRSGRLWPMN